MFVTTGRTSHYVLRRLEKHTCSLKLSLP